MKYEKQIARFEKIARIIHSCRNEMQIDSCARMLDNYYQIEPIIFYPERAARMLKEKRKKYSLNTVAGRFRLSIKPN